MDNWTVAVFVALALFSGPLTRLGVRPSGDFSELPAVQKLLALPASLFAGAVLLFPLLIAYHWAELLEQARPDLEHQAAKAIVVLLCWAVLVLQLAYRIGLSAGRREVR